MTRLGRCSLVAASIHPGRTFGLSRDSQFKAAVALPSLNQRPGLLLPGMRGSG
ncbi:MAG: hypothetical protein JW986_05970 [Methanotrichaceae archaeon]|nr:hypothetical protein [Methanotrichaceae archaeon]